MTSLKGEQAAKRQKKRGHMFLVDLPSFAKVCDLGDADAAATYLILAAGTGADNRTSTWSREAINKRTALNWRKANAMMEKLERNGFIRWLEGKGTRKPRIDLPPVETRTAMPKQVATLADRIAQGEQPRTAAARATAATGKKLGWLTCNEAGIWSAKPSRDTEMVFLPMELVGDAFGMAREGSTSIVERIRMARDPQAFRLLLDLYALQDLVEHNGVDRQHFYQKFEREKAGATGTFQLWEYVRGNSWVSWNGPLNHHWREPSSAEKKQGRDAGSDFFERASIIADAGALEWVYFLAEDASSNANLIYPVAVERHGKLVLDALESIVGFYATRAACALAGGEHDNPEPWEESAPGQFFLPADRLARQAIVVGVPRLRHRARTSNAARWQQELAESAETWIATFRGIIAENAPKLLEAPDQRFADFNGASMGSSTSIQSDINDSSQSPMHNPPPISGENADATSQQKVSDVENDPFLGVLPGWLPDGRERLAKRGAR